MDVNSNFNINRIGPGSGKVRKTGVYPPGPGAADTSDKMVRSTGEQQVKLIPDMRKVFKSAAVEDKKETIKVRDMFISLAGSPGAGKTTQGKLLASRYGIPHISVGKLLRKEIADNSVLGLMVKHYVQRGDLAPSHLVAAVVKKRLSKPDCRNGFILDGYPRRMEDVEQFKKISDELGIKNFRMIGIEVEPEVVIERLKYRRVCDNGHMYDLKNNPPAKPGICDVDQLPLKQRSDDKLETIKHRFAVYRQETLPVMEYYKKSGKFTAINGRGSIEQVNSKLTDLLDPKDRDKKQVEK